MQACFIFVHIVKFVRCPISGRINSTSILAQSGNNRRSFNQSLLFEKKLFIYKLERHQQQTIAYGDMVTFPPRPVDIHGLFFCLHPRRCFRNQPRLSMISGLGWRIYSQRSGWQAQHDLGAFNAFSPEITNFERLLSFICPIEFTPVFVVASSCQWNSMELWGSLTLASRHSQFQRSWTEHWQAGDA